MKAPQTLLSWTEAASWQRHSPYILSGYRLVSHSLWTSLASIFAVHNETVSIWSHLTAAVYFARASPQLSPLPCTAPNGRYLSRANDCSDLTAVSIYCLGVTVCFALSATFHIFSDHSHAVHRHSNNLDHTGIVFGLWGTGMSTTHFALRCASSTVRSVCFAAISMAASVCAVLTLRPFFHRPGSSMFRALIYWFLGLCLFAPLYPAWVSLGTLEALDQAVGLRSFTALAFINSLGGALYVTKAPERWFPGKFDFVGQSHHWMHILVVLGAHTRLEGLLDVYGRWTAHGMAADFCQGTL